MSTAPPLILAFGDSLVAGYGLPTADGFAAQLERRLGSTLPGVNTGPGGQGATMCEWSHRDIYASALSCSLGPVEG